MALGMAPGGHWLGYLVAGPGDALEAGRRWFNWGWYRTGDDAMLRELLTDGSGRCHEHGIPHDLIRREHVERMRDEARRYLAPQIQAVVNATEWPFIQAMSDFGSERLKDHIRASVGLPHETDAVVAALSELVNA